MLQFAEGVGDNMDTIKDSLIAQAIDNAVTDLIPHGAGVVHEQRLRHILSRVAQNAATAGAHAALLGLRDSNELAEMWGVSKRRVQAHCAHLHERWGVGRRVGNAWMLTAEEAESHRPGTPGRKPQE